MGDMRKLQGTAHKHKFVQLMYNIVVAKSQLINVFLGGHPDESVSQHLGKRQLDDSENLLHKTLRIFVDWFFRVTLKEKEHCKESVTGESGARALWRW